MLLIKPPHCGKTWFSNIFFSEFMLNTGFIANSNKYSQSHSKIVCTKIYSSLTTSVEPASFEYFKLIFSGAMASVNIKVSTSGRI